MAAWVLGGGFLGAFVPALIRLLPEPQPSPGERGEAKELYQAISRLPWLMPVGVFLGLLGGLAVTLYLPVVTRLVWLPAIPILIALGVIDARTKLLPTRLVLPTTMLLLVLSVATHWSRAQPDLWRGFMGLALARSVFWLLWRFRSAGMGFGDVRLSALVGLLLALVGWGEFFVGLYAGLLVFALVGVGRALMAWNPNLLKESMPFGPFMILGMWCGLIAGDPLWHLVSGY
jgi:leader peptidase (prepilin peptidase) / N-methyltransferase